MTAPAEDSPTHVAAKRVTDVLYALTASEQPLSVRAIAEATASSRGATHRILLKLVEDGYAELSGAQGYVAGPKLIELGARAFAVMPVLRYADQLMQSMVDELGETCYLASFDEATMTATFIHRVESTQPVRHIQPLGRQLPLHAGAVGKALLAASTSIDLTKIDLERFTPHTLTDVAALRSDLALTRERGYAVSNAERVEDVVGVAARVMSGEKVVGGLTTAIPGSRFGGDDLERVAEVVVRYAGKFSEVLSAMGVRWL